MTRIKHFMLAALAVLAIAFPANAYAFEVDGICYNTYFNSTTNKYEAWVTSGGNYTGDIVIPSTVEYDGKTYPVTSIGDWAFSGCSSLTSIDMPSVTSIGIEAFSGCSSLESIDLPSVTSIGDYAFSGCSSLASIDMPSVTSIGGYAFYDCYNITAVRAGCVEQWCGISFYNYSTPFYSSPNASLYFGDSEEPVKELIIPESVKTIPYNAFSYCSSLASIDMPSVTSISSYAFSGCSSLESIDMPSVTSIGNRVFSGCNQITAVRAGSVEQWCGISFYDWGSTPFDYSPNASLYFGDSEEPVKDLVIPETVETIPAYAFLGVSSLTSIDLPSVTSIGDNAFYNCSSLTSINMPSVTSIGYEAFSDCSSLTNIDMPSVTSIGNNAFYNCSSLTSIDMPSVTSIGYEAFSDCSSLTSIDMPSVTSIGQRAFYNTYADIKIGDDFVPTLANSYSFTKNNLLMVSSDKVAVFREALPDMQHQIVDKTVPTKYDVAVSKELDNASAVLRSITNGKDGSDVVYSVCDLKVSGPINSYDIMVFNKKFLNLRSLDLSDAEVKYNAYEYYSGCHSENNAIGSYAFYQNSKLRKIVLPKGARTIGGYAFYECSSLKDVVMPDSLTTLGSYAFYGCISLSNVTLPSGLASVPSSSFKGCNGLKSIAMPEGVTSIDSYAFEGCRSLSDVSLPRSLKSIGQRAFKECYSMNEIALPPALEQISSQTFSLCYGLERLSIPASVKSIGDNAFSGCDNIKDIYTYIIEPTRIGENTFSSTCFNNATLHVQETAYPLYYWNTQWAQFQKIEEFNEPYEFFYLNNDLVMDEQTTRIDGQPDAELNTGSGLIVEGSEVQELGDVELKNDGWGNGGSIIGNGNITAKTLKIQINVSANRWYSFAFPFDIDLKDIDYPGSFVFRFYDGSKRAQQGNGGWQDIAGAQVLKAGQGYIFYGNKNATLTLSVGNILFDGNDRSTALTAYPSDNEQDASWNFIGNANCNYVDIASLGYDAPITVMNGSTYEAISCIDDDYQLYPYQAFFVQKPSAVDAIQFNAADRLTKTQSQQASAAAQARRRNTGRSDTRFVVNLTIADGDDVKDKTRVVVNPLRGMEYEMECDAAKFMNDGVAQLYSLDAQRNRYAINERPEGSGTVLLGVTVPQAGTYTIAATRMDSPVVLRDNATGTTHDLQNGAYTFSAAAGAADNRFELIFTQVATALRTADMAGLHIEAGNGSIAVDGLATTDLVRIYNTAGALVATQAGNGTISLPCGVYAVTVNGRMAQKVVVK